MNIVPGRPTVDSGPCSAGCSSTTTGAASSSPRAPNWQLPRISSRSRSSRSRVAPMPEPPRPGRRSSAGRPNKPAARPRSSRSRRNYRRAPAGEHGPGLARASGSLWDPMDLPGCPRAFGRRRTAWRSGMDPLPDRTRVPQGSRRGKDQSRTDGPVYQVLESRDHHHLGPSSPGRSGMAARPLTSLATEGLRYRSRHHGPTTHQEHRP